MSKDIYKLHPQLIRELDAIIKQGDINIASAKKRELHLRGKNASSPLRLARTTKQVTIALADDGKR